MIENSYSVLFYICSISFLNKPNDFMIKIFHGNERYKTEKKHSNDFLNTLFDEYKYEVKRKECEFLITPHQHLFSYFQISVFQYGWLFGKTLIGKGVLLPCFFKKETFFSIKLFDKKDKEIGQINIIATLKESETNFQEKNVCDKKNKQKKDGIISSLGDIFYFIGNKEKNNFFSTISGLIILRKFYKQKRKTESGNSINIKEGKKIYRGLKMAVASYGWTGIYSCTKEGVFLKASIQKQKDSYILSKYLSIEIEEIYFSKLKNRDLYTPKYFVCFDKELDSVVVSIRGTHDGKDVLVDLSCHYVPWNGGYVHGGIYTASKNLYDEIVPFLFFICQKKKKFNIYVTGHSLGGAIASFFYILISETLSLSSSPFKVQCQVFGTAAFMSFNLAEKYTSQIEAFIYRDDVVPSLSFGSLADLTNKITEIGINIPFSFLFKKKLEKKIEKKIEELEKDVCDKKKPRLYVPGTIYHIQKINNKKFLFFYADRSKFKNIKITDKMFIDHLPSSYYQIFKGLCRK